MTTRKKVSSAAKKTGAKKKGSSKTSLPAGVKNVKISPALLQSHDMRPLHILGVKSDQGRLEDEAGAIPAKGVRPAPARKGPPLKHLKVQAFADALHASLKNDVVGYCMRLQQHGSTIYTLQWNWAQTPSDNALGWNPSREMHVASVSKLITAIAMTRLLDKKGISYDAKIVDYLPKYWFKGPNINKISFRNLLTQTSGFATAHGETDYMTMKFMVMLGVSTGPPASNYVGKYRYENMNFGLCRILIAIINGNVNKTLVVPDNIWDIITITAYSTYVSVNVFSPSGVTDASLDHPANSALAYSFPVSGGGWNSGNLMTVSGGAGWHVSVNDLLKVMGTFRRKGTIMSTAKAQNMLDSGFGIDVISDTPAGRLYNKNGLWEDGTPRIEQSLAYFLPEDMELVVLTNSAVSSPAKFFRGVVTQIYLDHLA
jgi:Beta-lactamase